MVIYPVMTLFSATEVIRWALGELPRNERLNDTPTHVSFQEFVELIGVSDCLRKPDAFEH